MPDPRPDAEQVIARSIMRLKLNPHVTDPDAQARAIVQSLRSAHIPVGPVDAFRYAEERLLEDANVEAATEAFASVSAEEYNATWGIPAAIRAACRSARGEGA